MDETLALPSDKAALIALRTQQIIAYETGVANTIDPLAGSYFIEALTDRMEAEAEVYFEEIERRGGVVTCIEEGYQQREIAKAAYRYQQELDKEERFVVGVNKFVHENEEIEIPVLKIPDSMEKEQCRFVQKIRNERDNGAVQVALAKLKEAASTDGNTFEAILDACRVYATIGEMCDVLRAEWGEYVEPAGAMQPA
jgi:methylmalonyl-CoA mutase N-terminal domain/subunit